VLEAMFVPETAPLRVTAFAAAGGALLLELAAVQSTAACPVCGQEAHRVHSWYQRSPGDTSWAGREVRLLLLVRRWWCDNARCFRLIFTERLPAFIDAGARRTSRLASAQTSIAFAAGGEPGSRLAGKLGMPVSGDTLLRMIRRAPEPAAETPRALGVDEWAKRKRHSYGTILVDLEQGRVIDLLPDRSAASFAAWLTAHPGVEIISRDRGGEFIRGATDGAPEAEQVADRFHLLDNLGDAVKEAFAAHGDWLEVSAPFSAEDACGGAVPPERGPSAGGAEMLAANPGAADGSGLPGASGTSDAAGRAEARLPARQERYEKVAALRRSGQSIRQITAQTGMSRNTVRRYLRAPSCPAPAQRRCGSSKLAPYIEQLQRRWDEGMRVVSQLWREIRRQGFRGSRGAVARWAALLPRAAAAGGKPAKPVRWPLRDVARLFTAAPDSLKDKDSRALAQIIGKNSQTRELYELGQQFAGMLRGRQPGKLADWLKNALACGIAALAGFATGLAQDWSAVVRAFSSPWSNGQVEGQVNRLKTIKRQMYGRAGFDLLRKRVLASP